MLGLYLQHELRRKVNPSYTEYRKGFAVGVVPVRIQRQFYSPKASGISSQLYLDFVQVIFASRVLKANKIPLKPIGFNKTIAVRQ